MDKIRRLAVQLLLRCEESGYSNLVLKNALDREELSLRDKQFISVLVYGTLEKQRLLDALLNQYLKKPCEKLDAPVRVLLRCGLYQCRWMDSVPRYAAINSCVELTRVFKKSSASGMVNAVLRKAADAPIDALTFKSETERLGVLYSVSDSIAEMLLCAYPNQAEAILQGFSLQPAVTLRVNPLRATVETLCEELRACGLQVQPATLPGAVKLLQSGDVIHTSAFEKGLFHVQGLSSQLAALATGVKPGETVLDLCAAPGGKSVTLAEQMNNQGTLICTELQSARVKLVSSALERCGITCAKVSCGDASVFSDLLPLADVVLCDVPCSGTGTLSKKPDIRYKDLDVGREELTNLQRRILENASRYVKSGGALVYSTCSLDPAENEETVQWFLKKYPQFTLQPVSTYELPCIKQDKMATLLPLDGQNDGFFIAKLQKV